MVREIIFDINTGNSQRSERQWAGMQGEDNAAKIVFRFAKNIVLPKALYRIDFNSSGAGYQPSENLIMADYKIERLLPKVVTQYGGEIQVTAVITILDDNDVATGEVISYPVTIWLTDVEKDAEGSSKVEENISKMEKVVRQNTEITERNKFISETAAEQALIAAERTEKAQRSLEEGAEFVFCGGDAKNPSRIDLVVDDEISEYSPNPVANKAVARAIKDAVASVAQEAVLSAHPVGSLYFSSSSTDPATLFGGTWERVKDKFILAAGDVYKEGETGGEANHQLSSSEMPSHTHAVIKNFGNAEIDVTNQPAWAIKMSASGIANVQSNPSVGGLAGIGYTGGDTPHNNMPPYEVYYCWKRTA